MALKLPDSAVPMGDFPVAKAVDIDFNDGENLQEKLDNGKLGGGGSSMMTIPGVVLPYAGSTVPNGFLLCDGQAVSRTQYQNLFDVIGITYGDGDGVTTFNLPNLQDRFVQGAGANTVGTKKSAGLPNITGSFSITGNNNSGAWGTGTGAFIATNSDTNNYFSSEKSTGTSIKGYNFNASKTNSIYGKSTTVQPPAICMNYIIKY